MIEKWKLAGWSNDRLSKISFARETNSFYVDEKGNRHAKESRYEKYFDTWQEAKEYKIAAAKQQIVSARANLQRTQTALEEAEAMQSPPEAE